MSYTYIRSLVLPRAIGARWTEAQLLTTPVYDIYQQFSKIIHVASHPNYPTDINIDFSALQPQYADSQLSLEDWLVSMDGVTLPLLETLPSDQVRYISYMDASQAGYVARLAKIGEYHPENYPPGDLPDLGLVRMKSSTDVSLIHTKALITVNGFLHLTDTDGTHLFIKDGAITTRRSQEAHVGIMSFYNLSDLTKIPITDDMIHPEIPDRPLFERLDIRLPSDIGNKTVMLSVGGYLWLPEPEVCWVTGADTVSICLERSPLLQRYYESKQALDLSSLDLTADPANPDAVSIDEFTSDEVLRKYLTLSQSFVILLDAPNIFHRKLYLEHMGVPGNFVTQQDPTYPLVTGYGRMCEYWKRYEDGYWSVRINHGYTDNLLFDYRSQADIDVISAQRYPGRTYQRSRGYLLEIGSYL